ncbi:MAG TPA: tyrosine-protein phosphatase [Pyrinomonadaceae bacterium]
MKVIRRISPTVVVLPALILALSFVSLAQETGKTSTDVKIKNFGQLDERFYRGARPKERDLKDLAAMGIKTVIDLTDNSREYEQPAVEAAGLRYVNIPMVDKSTPNMDQINEFLKVVNDPETGKFFVHCAGGRHRTGVVGAVYRFNHNNWKLEQALEEMDRFEFETGYGHGKQKDFVKEYFQQFQATHAAAAGTNR